MNKLAKLVNLGDSLVFFVCLIIAIFVVVTALFGAFMELIRG
jgi:hypothetical protein